MPHANRWQSPAGAWGELAPVSRQCKTCTSKLLAAHSTAHVLYQLEKIARTRPRATRKRAESRPEKLRGGKGGKRRGPPTPWARCKFIEALEKERHIPISHLRQKRIGGVVLSLCKQHIATVFFLSRYPVQGNFSTSRKLISGRWRAGQLRIEIRKQELAVFSLAAERQRPGRPPPRVPARTLDGRAASPCAAVPHS